MFTKIKLALLLAIITSISLGSEWRSVPINAAFTYGLSVGQAVAKDDEKVVSNVMFNMLTGEVDSIQGIVLGGLINQVNHGVEGISLAGIAAITKDDVAGMQIAGIFNTSKNFNGAIIGGIANVSDTGNGIQIAGITNVSQSIQGLQVSGINNQNNGYLVGSQIAGIFNSARTTKGVQIAGITSKATSLEGVQTSGICNIAGNSYGAQIGGIYNHANNMSGMQIAGIASKANDINGIQISGIANVASKVEGLQVGLINIADENNGAAIGLISIDKSYGAGMMAWTDEQLFINAGLRTGTRKLYNLLFLGVRPDEKPYLSVGSGLGTRFAMNDNFSLDIDATAQYILQQTELNSNDFNHHFQSRLRVLADFRITREFGIFAGPTFNTTVSKKGEELELLNSSTSYVKRHDNEHSAIHTPGLVIGFRIN